MKHAFIISLLAIWMALASAADSTQLTGIVLTNDRTVDSTSNEAIIKGVVKEGMTEQQSAIAMWRFFIQRNMHKETPPVEDWGNAAELMTKYGYAICGTWARMYAELATDAGMPASPVDLSGHVVATAKYWGDWHTFDADMWALYPTADGVIASPSDIRHKKDANGKYVLREGAPIKSYPWYAGPDTLSGIVSLYEKASWGDPLAKHNWKWNYDLRLRPGMEISWSWYGDPEVGFVSITHCPEVRSAKVFKSLRDYIADTFDYYQQKEGKPKWTWGYRRGGLNPNPLQPWNGVCGNGRLTFDLGGNGFANALSMMESSENLQVKDGKLCLTDPAKGGSFVLNFKLPYTYGDGWIARPLPEKGLKIEISTDGKTFSQVYPQGGVDDGKRIRLFEFVRPKTGFVIKATLEPNAEPLADFKAVGVFHHCYTVLPGLVKGNNQIGIRLANSAALDSAPLHVTYVYDQVSDNRDVMRHEQTVSFKAPGAPNNPVINTGDKHWPLMREIRMRCGGSAPKDPEPVQEQSEHDWGSAPWDWVYYGVNFWNDFERGDRQGWSGKLVTKNTSGSDFALDNALMTKDGGRQLKFIRSGSFLNKDSKFRCQMFVKNIKDMRFYTRNQENQVYYEKLFTDLKDGQWQNLEIAINDLADPKDPAKKLKNGDFVCSIYMVVTPAEGKVEKDVEFLIDDPICYDGELKNDPFKDPDAAAKALKEDPIWNAKAPQK